MDRIVGRGRLVGAAEPEYDLRTFPGPAMGPGVELLTALMRHYQQITRRQLSTTRVMAWHLRTALGDVLWRSEAAIPLADHRTPPEWVDDMAARFGMLGIGPEASATIHVRGTAEPPTARISAQIHLSDATNSHASAVHSPRVHIGACRRRWRGRWPGRLTRWEPVRGTWLWRGYGRGAGPWRLRIDRGGKQSQAVLRVGEPHRREQLATEAAALAFAEEHQLAAPRLLAVDLDGNAAGRPILLSTVLTGSSRIPATASPGRLRALGAAVARVHAVVPAPRPGLPLRVRPGLRGGAAGERVDTGGCWMRPRNASSRRRCCRV